MLKELLGELFTDEIKAKLEGKELVLKSDQENMIPKDRFDKVNNEKKEYKAKVEQYQKEITDLSKGNESLEDIKAKLEAKTNELTEYQTNIETQQLNSKKTEAITSKLSEMNAIDPKLLVKEFDLSTISFDDNGGLVGVKETFDRIQTDYKQQFGKVSTQTPPPADGQGGSVSKEAFSKLSYSDRVALKTDNPVAYEQLTK